jgi:hypothetical protein
MFSSKEARLIICVLTLLGSFALIIMDGLGLIDIGKLGAAGVAAWITMILQFYVRKKPEGEKVEDNTEGSGGGKD